MTPDVIVMGGGLGGVSATVALAQRGISVMLLESRPRLGGRASSFVDQATGTTIDNCQHVSMGCCTNFRHFCETVGVANRLRTEKTLYFVGADRRINRFSASPLPAPLHLLPAFRRLSYLSRTDLRLLARGLRSLAKIPASPDLKTSITQPFDRWLAEQGQSPFLIENFWHVVLVSALSETLDRIDTLHARKVFFDGFLAHRDGWQVQIPTVPLEGLYGPPLLAWLKERGVSVRLKTGVEKLEMEGNRVSQIVLRDGETLSADQYVLAVPHHRVASLLPALLAERPAIAGLSRLESAPISSVHLWLDRSITDLPHAVLIGRLSQWMFNRSLLLDQAINNDSHYYQVVISASRELQGRSQEQIIAEVIRELAEIWPKAGEALIKNARVVTEHRAVFSVTAGSDAWRLPQQSSVDNLLFAGDWTQTGWPATMEGAVRSGYLAAENILSRRGNRDTILQPDLPVSWLTRIFLGDRREK